MNWLIGESYSLTEKTFNQILRKEYQVLNYLILMILIKWLITPYYGLNYLWFQIDFYLYHVCYYLRKVHHSYYLKLPYSLQLSQDEHQFYLTKRSIVLVSKLFIVIFPKWICSCSSNFTLIFDISSFIWDSLSSNSFFSSSISCFSSLITSDSLSFILSVWIVALALQTELDLYWSFSKS